MKRLAEFLGLLPHSCYSVLGGPFNSAANTLAREVSPDGICLFQIITALEEDGTAQKMQLGYRLQQIAAAVENKVTDL